jgi:hypothetical protein
MEGKPIPRAKYVLICDDIREEKSNKIILVGLYANKILLDSVPGLIPKLCIRICFDLSRPYADTFDIAIRKPDGVEIGPFTIKIPPPVDEFLESSINLNIVPFPLESEGTYEILAREEGQEEKIGRFGVQSLQVPRGKPS